MKIAAVPENIIERVLTFAGLVPTPIIDTFHAVIVARAVVTATKLGVFEAVAGEPRTVEDISKQLGVDKRALEKLLNVLVATRYLKFRGGCYAPTRMTRKWLLRDAPQSIHDNILLRLLEWQAIEKAEDFVRSGSPLDVHDLIEGEQWDTYQRGMNCLARLSAGEVARRLKLPQGAGVLLDIGGGHGAYSVAFCRRNRQWKATVFDLPDAVASAAPILAAENMGARVVHQVGDALSEDFGADKWDLVFISHLVHHFDEAMNEDLVRRAARALRPGGMMAILDVLRPASPNANSQTGALLDFYFAITSNSGTWSREEITNWQQRAGLEAHKTIALQTAPGVSIVTAVKPAGGT